MKSKWLDVFPSSENKSKIPKDHFAIYKAVTDYSFVERNKINGALESILRKVRIYGRMCTTLEFRTVIIPLIKKNRKIGIPQGASVSDVLSNIYMLDFDSGIAKAIAALGGIYKRYCDDIIVVVPIADYQKVQDTIFNKIKELNLIINPSKTELKEFNRLNGKLECCDILTGQKSKLQYLGAEFDGENFYLRHKGITKFDSRMARMIRSVVHYSRENEGLLPKKRLYRKFSHLGASNYLTYAKRAGRKLSSKTIKRQTSPERIMRKIKSRIEKTKSKMAKTKAEKGVIIDKLEDAFKTGASSVFVHFTKVTVTEESAMRRALRADGVSYFVAKKTLMRRALEKLGHAHESLPLEGEVAVAYGGGEDSTVAARLVHEFGKKFTDKLTILGGIFDGKFVDGVFMTEIATIPSREVLLSKIAFLLKSPIQRLAIAVNEVAKSK